MDEDLEHDLARLSQLESGITHQRALVVAAPKSVAHRFRLAELLADAGRHAEARNELEIVLRRRRQFLAAALLHAECSRELGELSAARGALGHADRMFPGNGRVELARARIELAEGRAVQALATFRRAESLLPESAEVQEGLARLLLEGGDGLPIDAALAATHARRARELGSQDVLLLARSLAVAGERAELRELVSSLSPELDGRSRRALHDLLEEQAVGVED